MALFVATTAEASTSRWATLEAIHSLENPRNLTRPGKFGELGAYQFRVSTWRMHTKVPFRQALDRSTSDEVAVRHYEWLKDRLEAAGKPATAYNIALAWNSGLSAAISGRSPKVAHAYAQRAANLAASLAGRAQPAVAEPSPVEPPRFTAIASGPRFIIQTSEPTLVLNLDPGRGLAQAQ